jgi:hypothetical protein
MDDPSYFDSLADDSVAGATVSGNLRGSHFETEYAEGEGVRTHSQSNDGTTFAAATPSSLGQRSAARNRSHTETGITERERYWKSNTPLLEKLNWN